MNRSLTILCAAKLHRNQLERHLELFEFIPEVKKVLVVRREPLETRLTKIENHSFRPASLVSEWSQMSRTVHRLIAEQQVDWVIGFNPVPWGSVALGAAKIRGVPSCLSLIGKDFLQIQRLWGLPFLSAVRAAEAITVTGVSMKQRLAELGVAENKIRILPHSVDLQRFVPGTEPKRWDVISVGQLIKRKRMDVLIDAAALLKSRGKAVRVGILGQGPLEAELKNQVERLGLRDWVEFLGYRDSVEQVLAASRVFCLASEWEGVPFALMEAMACGLIPIVTKVGTIEDWVENERNGLLVEVGEPVQLATAIEKALSQDGEKFTQCILEQRPRLALARGADVWRQVLGLDTQNL